MQTPRRASSARRWFWDSSGTVFFQRNDTETTTGGAYVFDSSVIYDTAASGFTLNVVEVSATGYFAYQSSSVRQVAPPYPVIQNLQLLPTGLREDVVISTNPSGLTFSVDGTAFSSAANLQLGSGQRTYDRCEQPTGGLGRFAKCFPQLEQWWTYLADDRRAERECNLYRSV